MSVVSGIQDSVGFWIPQWGSRITGTGFRISFVCGIPDSLICIPDSKGQDFIFVAKICWIPYSFSVELGFWISFVWGLPDFLIFIPGSKGHDFIFVAKICWIPDSTGKNFPDSGIRIPLYGSGVAGRPLARLPCFGSQRSYKERNYSYSFDYMFNLSALTKLSAGITLFRMCP